jgi:hypothetical protein
MFIRGSSVLQTIKAVFQIFKSKTSYELWLDSLLCIFATFLHRNNSSTLAVRACLSDGTRNTQFVHDIEK